MRFAEMARGMIKPHYLFRPTQLARRIAWRLRRESVDRVTVRLPWGMSIRCFAGDAIGLSLQQLGVFDLGVAEVLWRLADPGELALDVGANIGQMTALLARRTGAAGRVLAFEPNDEVRAELAHNVELWRSAAGVAAIDISAAALSDHDGEGELLLPPSYEWNRGVAEVAGPGSTGRGERRRIHLARLDTLVLDGARVGVMKLDVEGHEPAVLRGGQSLLAEHRVRDVVYEDHERYPSAVSRMLEHHGYRILAVGAGFWGPRVGPPGGSSLVASWESPSFLATLDPDRARARLRPRGWRVL